MAYKFGVIYKPKPETHKQYKTQNNKSFFGCCAL